MVWDQPPPRSALCADCDNADRSLAVAMSVKVTNTGTRAGAKVVMAFVAEATPRSVLHGEHVCGGVPCDLTAPHKSMFGMDKVFLAPGESRTVAFSALVLPQRDQHCPFCSATYSTGRRVVAPGDYTLSVGGDGGVSAAATRRADEVQFTITLTSANGGMVDSPF